MQALPDVERLPHAPAAAMTRHRSSGALALQALPAGAGDRASASAVRPVLEMRRPGWFEGTDRCGVVTLRAATNVPPPTAAAVPAGPSLQARPY